MPSLTEQTKPQPDESPGLTYRAVVVNTESLPPGVQGELLDVFGSFQDAREAICEWVLTEASALLEDSSTRRIIETAEFVSAVYGPALEQARNMHFGMAVRVGPVWQARTTLTEGVEGVIEWS